jgi:hypothetical protein
MAELLKGLGNDEETDRRGWAGGHYSLLVEEPSSS